jgi:hypothetical protein
MSDSDKTYTSSSPLTAFRTSGPGQAADPFNK